LLKKEKYRKNNGGVKIRERVALTVLEEITA